ncbi:hypothetical protein GQ607_005027, partial [Colletotrichum asianum]
TYTRSFSLPSLPSLTHPRTPSTHSPCASLPAPIDRYPCSGSQLGSLWGKGTPLLATDLLLDVFAEFQTCCQIHPVAATRVLDPDWREGLRPPLSLRS